MPPRLNEVLTRARDLQRAGDFRGAAVVLGTAVRDQPENADLLFHFGAVLVAVGDLQQACERLERVIALRPRHAHAHYSLAVARQRLGQYDEAHRLVDRALELEPDDEALVAGKASLHNDEGDFTKAFELLRARADQGNPLMVIPFARACRALGRTDEGIGATQRLSRRKDLAPAARMEALYMLAGLYNDADRYDEAFAAARAASEIHPPRFDAAAHRADVDSAISGWTRGAIEGLPPGSQDDRPVFIVGMPRSGSTLVEQILSCHPHVASTGESAAMARVMRRIQPDLRPSAPMTLTDVSEPLIQWGADEYLSALPDALRVTDKNLLNFLHLGLISRLFPNARVVHCMRHPLDTCLSCFLTHFPAIDFTDRLEDLASFHADYLRLMRHWREVVDLPILDLGYEQMVADQERESRRLVEFLGLDWDDACLRFHESERTAPTASVNQVARPIYDSSVHRHKHYARHLTSLASLVKGTPHEQS